MNRAPSVLINSGSAPFLHSLPTACQIIVVQVLRAKPTGLCVQSSGSISSLLTPDKRNKHFTKMGEETSQSLLRDNNHLHKNKITEIVLPAHYLDNIQSFYGHFC